MILRELNCCAVCESVLLATNFDVWWKKMFSPPLSCDMKTSRKTFHFKRLIFWAKDFFVEGSGCGSVGRAVASDTRDPPFESRHQHNYINRFYNRNDKNKEKEARNGPSLKKNLLGVRSGVVDWQSAPLGYGALCSNNYFKKISEAQKRDLNQGWLCRKSQHFLCAMPSPCWIKYQ